MCDPARIGTRENPGEDFSHAPNPQAGRWWQLQQERITAAGFTLKNDGTRLEDQAPGGVVTNRPTVSRGTKRTTKVTSSSSGSGKSQSKGRAFKT